MDDNFNSDKDAKPRRTYDEEMEDYIEHSTRLDMRSKHVVAGAYGKVLSFIETIHPVWLLLSALCMVPEYFVWTIHYDMWQRVNDYDPTQKMLAGILAVSTVMSAALMWDFIFTAWYQWRRKRRSVSIGIIIALVISMCLFGYMFYYESHTFYEFLIRDRVDAFGEPLPGATNDEAWSKIGSWSGANMIFGLVTGYCFSRAFKD